MPKSETLCIFKIILIRKRRFVFDVEVKSEVTSKDITFLLQFHSVESQQIYVRCHIEFSGHKCKFTKFCEPIGALINTDKLC